MRAALIPMKELSQAKMRLADVLDRDARGELALAMLTDVIAACDASGCFDIIVVISNDSEVFWQAREMGAKPLAEPGTISGLNESLTFGQRYLARRVAVDEIIIVPADIPAVRPDDLRAVAGALAGGGEARAALVRSRDDGTNALAMRPPEAVAMRFGLGSADAHVAEAMSRGVNLVELDLHRVAFDVDSPDDLVALGATPCGGATTGWLDANGRSPMRRRAGSRR